VNTKRFSLWVAAALLGLSSFSVQAAVIDLYGFSLNIDENVTDVVDSYTIVNPLPVGVDDSLFDFDTGLGELVITIEGSSTLERSVYAFFDHEIDKLNPNPNTGFNETGLATGIPQNNPEGVQSWEIDEPWTGYVYSDFLLSDLWDLNYLSPQDDDVSMAMGWDFELALDYIAIISLSLSEAMPTSGFYLTQTDPDSNNGNGSNIYFSGNLDIIPVPEPSIIFLFGIGLTGLVITRRRMNKTG